MADTPRRGQRWAMSPAAVARVDQLAADAERRLDETVASLRSRFDTTERSTALGVEAIAMRAKWTVDEVLDIGLVAIARLAEQPPPPGADDPAAGPRCICQPPYGAQYLPDPWCRALLHRPEGSTGE